MRPSYGVQRHPAGMDLNDAAWMVRTLGQSVSVVHLTAEGNVLAGGWDGLLAMWDADGGLLWKTSTPDRVSAVAVNEDSILATSGLHVLLIDRGTGDMRWSVPLEGSADDVRWWNGEVLAVSSVYDIEHHDFLESAVWCFAPDGVLQWVERMDERPWSVVATAGRLLAGLGRPRCGWLDLSNGPPFDHVPANSPVTCGGSGPAFAGFGCADGSVWGVDGHRLSTEASGVAVLNGTASGCAVTTEDGVLTVREKDGAERWAASGANVHAQGVGLSLDGAELLWMARAAPQGSELTVLRMDDGTALASVSTARVRHLHANGQRLAIGCEDGEVRVWEQGLFERRWSQRDATVNEPQDERASALQAKLRALRG